MKKIVIFGAGKIGRSFLGQVFGRAGYTILFVDVFQPLIDELNKRKSYEVVIKSDTLQETIRIQNVFALHANQQDQIIQHLTETTLAATCVGKNALTGLVPLLSEAIGFRYRNNFAPLDIILAENMRDAAGFMYEALTNKQTEGIPLRESVGLIETSIGKMVPIMSSREMEDDMLKVYAEPYNTLIVDKKGFCNPIPEIDELAPKENIKAWVDRKLFIHNLGHAAAAYLGYQHNPHFTYLFQALGIPEILKQTREAMQESGSVLLKMYPREFTVKDINQHIDDLLARFQNRALGDTIFRVGCDLYRKLGPDDRIIVPLTNAMEHQLSYQAIKKVLLAAMSFRAVDETGKLFPKDVDFQKEINRGSLHVLKSVCKLNEHQIKNLYQGG